MRQGVSEYATKLDEYENDALKIRELLWERAHVCMRCGTTYLGVTHKKAPLPL